MTLNLPEPQTPERTPAVTAATVPRHRHLTPAMRDALRAARSQPLRRVVRTAEVSRKGFRMDVWTITDVGVEALRPVESTRRPRPLLIAEGWPDFTYAPGRAMRGEPGVLPDDEPAWLSEAA
jgi:hypothetical protein